MQEVTDCPLNYRISIINSSFKLKIRSCLEPYIRVYRIFVVYHVYLVLYLVTQNDDDLKHISNFFIQALLCISNTLQINGINQLSNTN